MTDAPRIADLNEFMPPWFQEDLKHLDENSRKRFLAEYEAAIEQLAAKLESLPINKVSDGTERGKSSVRIPGSNKFINLKSTLWTLVKYGGPLVLASTIAAPLLAAVGITLAGTVSLGTAGSAVAALYGTFASLNSVEMDTYLAVAAAIERNKMRILGNSGASLAQVMQSFERDKELMRPDDPEAVLKDLVDKKVLTQDASTGLSQYFLAF
jgi:hypothetical protein